MTEKKEYRIRSCGTLVPVTQDRDAISVEDTVIRNTLHEEVRHCVSLLETEEQFLVYAIFYKQLSEREFTKILGIPQKAVNKRRHKALDELRRLMKN